MTNSYQPEDVASTDNERALKALVRAIVLSQGQFRLILVRCNYAMLRDSMKQRLQKLFSQPIRQIVLPESVKTLYTTIKTELDSEQPSVLMLFGLESVSNLDRVIISTNQVREEFRENLPFPIVLWINDRVLQKLIRLAPDFESWATTVEFKLAKNDLLNFLQQKTEQIFAAHETINLANCFEILAARKDLQRCRQELKPELEANLEFIEGIDSYINDQIDNALMHYHRSLNFYQHNNCLEKQGILLLNLALAFNYKAEQNRAKSQQHWQTAKNYLQQCINVLEQAQRLDLVARHINKLVVVMQHLQEWEELKTLVQKALLLHQQYDQPLYLAQDYGFLAEVALKNFNWQQAYHYAHQALQVLARIPVPSHEKALYQFLLALSQEKQGQLQEAIDNLEKARQESWPQHNPKLYISILGELRALYYQHDQYLEAFRIKQEQRLLEYQYGFQAFAGASYLQQNQQDINPTLTQTDRRAIIALEIAASGRQQDVDRLIDQRISHPEHKLTVIYGQSGVGKSSILTAGLLPALKQRSIDSRDTLPIVLRVYTNWIGALGKELAEALEEVRNIKLLTYLDSVEAIIQQLQKNAERNLLTILIFDQIEEFFFICKEREQRQIFYDFLYKCLDTYYVKVILSIHEDCLHYLLEFNRRTNLSIINNNILDKDILYHLGNFSIEDAEIVIKSLTERSEFKLDSALIEQLVNDLAEDLGEVRPIELQVVGAQLQEENITTLKQYLSVSSGSKKVKLVERYLAKAIEDCGIEENTKLARLVLYLLTNEDGTCPLKTRAELMADLKVVGLKLEANKLDSKLGLVLEILVGSGMVLLVPESPSDRYQLVHDYLVEFIRQEQSYQLLVDLKTEKDRRKRIQRRFNQFLFGASLISFVGLLLFAALALIAEQQRTRAEIGEIKALADSSKALSASHQQFDALIESLRARKRLRFLQSSNEAGVVAALRQAVYGVKERNRLERHEDWVNSVSFSPNAQMLATVSGNTVKLWQPDGKEISSFTEHEGRVTTVTFSPNGQIIATASEDSTVKLWQWDGKKSKNIDTLKHDRPVYSASFSPNGATIVTACDNGTVKVWQWDGKKFQKRALWKGHKGEITSVSFSPDGQTLATASEDNTVKLWRWNGKESKEIDTLKGHTDRVYGVSFSPDGKTIASASWDYTVKLWNWDGKKSKEIGDLKGHTDRVYGVSFSPDGKTIATASGDKTIKLWSGDGTWKEVDTQPTTLTGYERRISGVSFSLNDRATTTASKEVDAQPITLTGHEGRVLGVSFSPDGKTIATASEDRTARIWRRDNGLLSTLSGHREEVYSISFSPDKQPDKQIVATASMDNTVKLWSRKGTLLTTLQGHNDRVWGVSFSPVARQILATASWDDTVKLWKWDGKEVQEITSLKTKDKEEEHGRLFSVSFSPDGKRIVAVGSDKKVRLWSRNDKDWHLGGKALATSWDSGHSEYIVDVSFSPDGKMIATASDDSTVKLWKWDGASFIRFITLTEHTNEVNGVSFSPDGKLIATASDDQTVKLWQQDGTFITTLGKHEDRVISVNFSPDSQTIASASFDKTVKLWDANTRQLLKTLSNHNDWVWDVNFSPDGKLLASTSSDKSAQLWHLDSTKLQLSELDTLAQRGCNWVQDYLKNKPRDEQIDRKLCD